MLNARKAMFLAFVPLFLAGCGSCMHRELTQTRSFLEAELKLGDPRERIEEVLGKAGVLYEYDPFNNRYQGLITADRCRGSGVVVYVNLDYYSGRMSRIEVFESFTGL
jgi:hypothetical protein